MYPKQVNAASSLQNNCPSIVLLPALWQYRRKSR